jgi:hypothetical protein
LASFLWKSVKRKATLKIISLNVPFLFSSQQHRKGLDVWFVSLYSLVTGEGLQWIQCWYQIYFQGLRDDVRTNGKATWSNKWVMKSACPHSTYCHFVYKIVGSLFQQKVHICIFGFFFFWCRKYFQHNEKFFYIKNKLIYIMGKCMSIHICVLEQYSLGLLCCHIITH